MISSQGYLSCGADANMLIERWFGDCVYTSWDAIAFLVGISSVCFWIVAQLPQFISNFLRKSADALSPWFLAQWLAGDTFNFLGCVLTGDQLATQTITAGYFMFSDAIIITQYLYYQIRNGKDAYYSDSDESLHKGSGYADLQKSESCKVEALEKILEQNVHLRTSKGEDKHGQHSSVSGKHLSSLKNQAEESDILSVSALKSDALLKEGMSSNVGVLTMLETSGKQPKLFIDLQQHGKWMYEHRHRLRRLVEQYGLEDGNVMVSRRSSLYKNKRKGSARKGSPADVNYSIVPSKRSVQTKALVGVACLLGLVSTINLQTWSSKSYASGVGMGHVLGRRALLSLSEETIEPSLFINTKKPIGASLGGELLSLDISTFSWTVILGRFLGWGSSALYLGSRVSQLVKNRERETADGLSLGMVTCAILANLTYGMAIVMRTSSWSYLIGKAPWLVGSFGTILLDLTIFVQAQYYSRHTKKGAPSEYTPLLA